jgi:hypothetical protein
MTTTTYIEVTYRTTTGYAGSIGMHLRVIHTADGVETVSKRAIVDGLREYGITNVSAVKLTK